MLVPNQHDEVVLWVCPGAPAAAVLAVVEQLVHLGMGWCRTICSRTAGIVWASVGVLDMWLHL